jgi:hypothetical protein
MSRLYLYEPVKVFRVYRDVGQIWLDVFCLPTFARRKEVRESHDRVGWKFRMRERYFCSVFEEGNGEDAQRYFPYFGACWKVPTRTAVFYFVMNSSSDMW